MARGRLIVISAPSGAGKTTLVKSLLTRNPNFVFSISYTTRAMRPGERDGVDYRFVTKREFKALVAADELLEWAEVFDNFYGTSRADVDAERRRGRHVVLEIDWQGARQVRAAVPDCRSIFILPPSVGSLRERLVGRKNSTGAKDDIERRLRDSLTDLAHWDEFDYVVVNDAVERATDELEGIALGRLRRNRVGTQTTADRVAAILAAG
ncbi:MAG: guanylate kinase [Pseudomonadota bacterium]